jgi:acetyl-CoA carboxylase beta subunit
MLDMVVERAELKTTLANIVGYLCDRRKAA